MQQKVKQLNYDKQAAQLQLQLQKEKNDAIMEVKSKELTSYALQLIDKDQAINEMMEMLKSEAPVSHKTMRNKINKNSKNLWDEFNMRFMEVNSKFYENLREKHPDLTPTEQKHCALIKLNFDSKEMAHLLNISHNSVHISRYRIRKKMKLSREDSLSNYIADL